MNDALRYGIGVVGWRYALDYLEDRVRRGLRRKAWRAPPDRISPSAATGPKVLYVYDEPGCAIHNVGLSWFSLCDRLVVDAIDVWSLRKHPSVANGYDYVWFGFLGLKALSGVSECRDIVSVHDPIELYSDSAGWRTVGAPAGKVVGELRSCAAVVTTSVELQEKMVGASIRCWRIPTAPLVPLRPEPPPIDDGVLRIISVGRLRRRKHPELLLAVRDAVTAALNGRVVFTYRWQSVPLRPAHYTRLLDSHHVYLCTSYAEGGPLPAMDAMRRGEAVLSTPVGQIQEILRDGCQGSICRSRGDFVGALLALDTDRSLLNRMRQASLQAIAEQRSKEIVMMAVARFAEAI